MKIIIAIGQSASGKTTHLKKHFIPEGGENKTDGLVKYYKINNTVAIGHYYIGKRCEGCDTLSYAAMPKIIDFIKKSNAEIIIVDGDRIASKKFFQFLKTLKIDIDVYYFSCSIEKSLERRGDDSVRFVKSTITKSQNMFLLAKLLGFNVNIIKT